MFLVVTSILLYAVNPASSEHSAAARAVSKYRAGTGLWFITWGVVYEFLRVSTHRAIFDRPLALESAREWIEAVNAGPGCRILSEPERHAEVCGS